MVLRLSTFAADVRALLVAPGPIGGTTPSTGAFTTLSANGVTSTRSNGGTGAALIAQGAGNAAVSWYDTAAAADVKKYDMLANAGTLHFRILNDAETIANDWLTVGRSGSTPGAVTMVGSSILLNPTNSVSLAATTISVAGALVVTGAAPTGTAITALLAAPGPIGSTTPSSGAFTTLSASGAVSGAGITALLAAPGPIGSTTASTGAFTTLSASSTVSGAGITALLAPYAPLASPTFTGTATLPSVNIDGGTIDATAIGATTPSTGAFTTLSASGAVSGAGITALHAAPGPIGSTTPSTGAFTTLSASGAVSGAGITALLAAPGPIGSTTASTGAFTTLSASSTVSGAGFTVRFAAPGPIGSTTPSTGAFTGISLGSNVGASNSDLSKHIALWSTTYGFSVTSNRINHNVPTSAGHWLLVNGVDQFSVLAGAVAVKAGTLSITDPGAGSTSSLVVICAGSNGSNIELAGNGATTPNKFLRVISGKFAIVNSGYTAEILSLTDAGALAVSTGNFTGGDVVGSTGCYVVQAGISSSPVVWSFTCSVSCANGIAATGFLTTSDRRAKREIRAIDEAQGVAYVLAGKPVLFRFDDNTALSAGFIAQDDLDAGAGREQAVGVVSDERAEYAAASAHCSPASRLVRNYEFDNAYLTAALQNALRRIAALERKYDGSTN